MKNYLRQNYYELLEVSPEATLEEINRAYQAALEAFGSDSLATYSLFDESERGQLLLRLQEAYRTLSNGRSRREYDLKLLAEKFYWSAKVTSVGGEEAKEMDELKRAGEAGLDMEEENPLGEKQSKRLKPERLPLSPLVKNQGEPLAISAGQVIRGADLKRLRESRGVSLEELFQRTRIKIEILRALEDDDHASLPALVYVKGFLKAYAKSLLLDPELLAQSYVAGLTSR